MSVPHIKDDKLLFFEETSHPGSEHLDPKSSSKDYCLLSTTPWNRGERSQYNILTILSSTGKSFSVKDGCSVVPIRDVWVSLAAVQKILNSPTPNIPNDQPHSLKEYGFTLYDFLEQHKKRVPKDKELRECMGSEYREIGDMKQFTSDQLSKAMEEATAQCIATSMQSEIWSPPKYPNDYPQEFLREALRCQSSEPTNYFETSHANIDLTTWTEAFGSHLGLSRKAMDVVSSSAKLEIFGIQ